jgi:hypothetical protein
MPGHGQFAANPPAAIQAPRRVTWADADLELELVPAMEDFERGDSDARSRKPQRHLRRGASSRGRRDAALEGRLAAEAAVLDLLTRDARPFRVPRPIHAPIPHQTATIRTFVPGVELDLRAGRQPGVRPWQAVGELAAAVQDRDAGLVLRAADDRVAKAYGVAPVRAGQFETARYPRETWCPKH